MVYPIPYVTELGVHALLHLIIENRLLPIVHSLGTKTPEEIVALRMMQTTLQGVNGRDEEFFFPTKAKGQHPAYHDGIGGR